MQNSPEAKGKDGPPDHGSSKLGDSVVTSENLAALLLLNRRLRDRGSEGSLSTGAGSGISGGTAMDLGLHDIAR